jgi:ABC-type glycerol-3-phosphate transport system substrate-binding protein
MKRVLAGLAAVAIALSAAPSFAQETLTVWWVKGFYKSEDDALYAAIKKFEAKTGVKVELSQYAVQDMNAKSVAALDAGTVPDIAYRPDEGPLLAQHGGDDVPLQRQGQEEGLLRLPDQAADPAHPVLEGHAGPGRLQGKRHPRHVE